MGQSSDSTIVEDKQIQQGSWELAKRFILKPIYKIERRPLDLMNTTLM